MTTNRYPRQGHSRSHARTTVVASIVVALLLVAACTSKEAVPRDVAASPAMAAGGPGGESGAKATTAAEGPAADASAGEDQLRVGRAVPAEGTIPAGDLSAGSVAADALPSSLVGTAPNTSKIPNVVSAEDAQVVPGGALFSKHRVDRLPSEMAPAMRTLPTSVNLIPYTVKVGNQNPLGSCTVWAIDYAMLGYWARLSNVNAPDFLFNPMFTFSIISTLQADGTYAAAPWTAMTSTQNRGNDTQTHYRPTSTTSFSKTDQPDASELANALKYEFNGFDTLVNSQSGAGQAGIDRIKNYLYYGYPVAVNIPVWRDFWLLQNQNGAYYDVINSTLQPNTGRHEVLAVGYDQYGLWVQNSWGSAFGKGGFARLAWNLVSTGVIEAYAARGLKSGGGGTVDTTPPTMSAVPEQVAVGYQVTSAVEPVKFNWSASDASGIAGYQYAVSVDGVWPTAATATTGTQIVFNLSVGHTYQVAVRAKDNNGNLSAYSYSASVKPAGFQDDTYWTLASGGPWTRSQSSAAFNGSYSIANQAGAYWSYSVTGRDIALISPIWSTGGRAALYCDGTYQGMIDEGNASTYWGVVVGGCRFSTSATHTIKVVLEGTSGRPSFVVDAFAVLS